MAPSGEPKYNTMLFNKTAVHKVNLAETVQSTRFQIVFLLIISTFILILQVKSKTP